MTADRFFGFLFALLGAGMFYTTLKITQAFPDSGDPGPRLLPAILALLMILLGSLLALRAPCPAGAGGAGQADLTQPTAPDDNVPTQMLPPPPLARRLGIGAVFVVFLALFEPLGFSLASSLFLAITMSLMDELTPRRVVTRSLAAVVIVLLLGLLLAHVLKLPVAGVWFA